jgi:rhomboid protease GluP
MFPPRVVQPEESADSELIHRQAFAQALMRATPVLFVTPLLVAINVAVYVVMVVRGVSAFAPLSDALLQWGANYGPFTTHGQWWRLLTATFVHGGLLHLAMNMVLLFAVGRTTERLYGNAAYLALYLLTAIGGSLAGIVVHPFIVSVGASGAVFGLFGGLLGFLIVRRRDVPGSLYSALAKDAALIVGGNLVYGFVQPGIDMTAHIAGFSLGVPLGMALATPLVPGLTLHRLLRTAVVTAVTAALFLGVARRVDAVDDWMSEFNRFVALEQRSESAFNEAVRRMQAHELRPQDVSALVEQQLLPDWESERNRLSSLKLSPEQHRVAQGIMAFMTLRADSWRLTADGLVNNDAAKVREGELKEESALEALQTVIPGKGIQARLEERRAARKSAADFDGELARMRDVEQTVVKLYNDSVEKVRSGRMRPAQFSATVNEQVLPPWDRMREHLAALPVRGPRKEIVDRLVHYMTLRGESWRLAAKGVATSDAAVMRQAAAKNAEALALLQQGQAAKQQP